MKAIVYHKYGSIEHLQLEEIEKPHPKDNEVLIKIHAAALNSWDWDLVKGTLQGRIFGLFSPKYKILGADVAGTIEAVGKNVTDFKIGDAVFGDLSEDHWGGFAEYVCANEKYLLHKPPSLTFEQAAATPQAGLLAIQALFHKRPITKGQEILINGAGGGVGTFCIQIAKSYGLEVTAVDKKEKLDALRKIGANHLIDYQQTDYTKTGEQYDLIIDNVAHRNTKAYSKVLKSDGVFIMIGGKTGTILNALIQGSWVSKRTDKHIGILAYQPNKEDLNNLTKLIISGKVQPIIDKTFSLENTIEAFRHYEAGSFVGNIVVKVI